MNETKDSKKPVLQSFRLTDDLDRRLSEFNRETGIPKSKMIRDGIELALEKYQPLLEVARA
jgi:predicted DNA-binding protein